MVRIPAEYQEVEYLESSGTQYIDTGYVPVEDTWVDCEYGFSDTYSGEQVILGASSSNYNGGNTTGLTVQLYNRNRWYCGCGGSLFGNVLTDIGKDLYIKHRVTLTKDLLTVDGNEQGNPGRTTFDPSQPCYLYAINAYSIGAQRLSKTLRLYSVKLYENENIMRDFIPCYRKSDNEPGMYDTVTKQFFTNAGTGTFLVGNDVSWEAIDLLALRRMVMLGMASGAWKKITVTAPDSYTNAKQIADWLTTIKPDANALFALRDAQDTLASENGTLLLASLYDNVPYSYIRMYSGNRDSKASDWLTAYNLSVDSGDKYTILYQ